MLDFELVIGVSLLYVALLFLVAFYAERKQELGQSVISNSLVYALSIAVYETSWAFYGSVGKAATTGLDFLLPSLGATLTVFSWWFLLRKMVRIAKENNITSIADFISSRYGKSQWLGVLVTIIAILGIMPYIALQLKAVSTTFDILCGYPLIQLPFTHETIPLTPYLDFFAALILSVFGVVFGARRLVSSERHEGLVAAIAVGSIIKLAAFLTVGIFVTYFMFNGFTDIFSRTQTQNSVLLDHLTTIGEPGEPPYLNWFAMLTMSMGVVMLLPRQFQMMVIENSAEEHIKNAMWLFPAYTFLINLFVVPIALGGILHTGGSSGADFFVLTLPLKTGHQWLALFTFLGGVSAAAGMVMVESVAIATMFLNHLIMPIVVRLKPRSWFPVLLINLKRFGIFLVVFLGYIYEKIVGETYMLINIGIVSFVAIIQLAPAFIGGLYWRRGNRTGAFIGILLGFLLWFYTLLVPSFMESGWWQSDILQNGPFGLGFLKPTELFGLSGFDTWTHSLFWSMFFNIGCYLIFSIAISQDDMEQEQAKKFVDVFKPEEEAPSETKRLSKPVTIVQFVNLMSKFIGEAQAHAAISDYMGEREVDEKGGVSEFELPALRSFAEKTLAGAMGAAAAGAVVESYLSDMGSRLEPVYDIYSKVRTDLKESRENLYVRLRASEIMNRTLDLRIIMDELLELVCREFRFDLAIIRLINAKGALTTCSHYGKDIPAITEMEIVPDINRYIGDAFLSNKPRFVNDTTYITKPVSKELIEREGIRSFAHIPIVREGEPHLGILSVYSTSIVGLFTPGFLDLLSSLAGQLAQAVKIDSEMKARELERREKERVLNEMEIAKQIQLSLLPANYPELKGVQFACCCVPATHVGGDYYDFFPRGESTVDVVIADVSGHSVGAALIMTETRSVLRAQIRLTSSAGEILSELNELLHEDLSRAELFITMFYAKYDAARRLLMYANAGHNPPLLFRPGEMSFTELDAEGLILGIKREVAFEEKCISLQTGDLLLIYTDGIIEAQNEAGELFGVGRLSDILAANHEEPPGRIIDAVLKEVTVFSRSPVLQDDISMVLMKIAPL